jgi:outer membrane protein assembly factor BamE (lipoprotein component of BamABCDE complex)
VAEPHNKQLANATFKWRRVFGLLALIVAVGLSTLAAIHFWKARPLPFDRAVWNAEVEDLEDFRRHRMADWLVQRRRLIGMSRDEVLSTLGEPTVTSHFREYDLVYVLGNERGWLSIDSEWLLMRLDDTGRVSAAEIARD